MFAWQATVQDEKGNAVPSPIVAVYNSDGVTLADIYDESGAVLANPFTGTAEGFVQFWALSGEYVVDGTKGTTLTEKWFVSLGDSFIVKDAAEFFALNKVKVGVRYYSKDGLAWDIVAPGAGRITHPVTGAGVNVVGGDISDLSAFNVPQTGIPGVSGNTIIGTGSRHQSGVPSRAPWTAIPNPGITVATHSLGMTGNGIAADVNSAHIYGGRPSYYSYVGPTASLSWTLGGDNTNYHLAGINFSMHSDLVKDEGGRGSHGLALGGSYHIVSGDYSGSILGQVKEVHALQSVSIGGQNIVLGDKSDSTLVRRSGVVGGALLRMASGHQSFMAGGINNTITAGDNSAIIGSKESEIDTNENGFIVSSQGCKVVAPRASVLSSIFAVADVQNAITRSVGRYATAGDSQTHHIEARRTSVGPIVALSVSGGSGVDLFTPPPNSRGVVELLITANKLGTVNAGAEYKVMASYSNLGGTLVVLGQDLTVIYEDSAAWNCNVAVAGAGTRIAATVSTGDTDTVLATATGRIVNQIFPA